MDANMDLRWYVRRLRAMPLAEVVRRGYRTARYPIDQLRMGTGRYARPSRAMRAHLELWRGPEPFYFDRALITTPVSRALREEAEAICAGQRRVLGLGWISFPHHGWHYEPAAQRSWPRVDAGRVVRVAPRNLDPRLTWELNRGHEWVVLARVYVATREPRFLEQLAGELASWRRSNSLGIGINWSSAMEAAIRIHALLWVAGFLRGTPQGPPPQVAHMIYEHATFVAAHRSSHSSANNHLLVELSGLIVAALGLGGSLRRLYAPALRQLTAEVARQVFADGVHAEMATHYHVFVLEALLLVVLLQRAHGAPSPALEAAVRSMAGYLRAVRCDDGRLLQQGDSDDGCILAWCRTAHHDQLLAAAAIVGARPRRRAPPPPATPEGVFWLTGGTEASPVDAPLARSRRFADSGQVVLRSARLHVSFDAGPFGFGSLAAHAHCDALAIALAVDGRRVLVDRGTYRYNGDRAARDRYRLTAAHNTAQIGVLEQAAPSGAFLWSRRPAITIHRCELSPDGDVVQASHDGFSGWTHRRTLLHRHGALVVIDEFPGSAAPERVVSRYHVAPELGVVALAPTRFRVEAAGSPLAWFACNARSVRVIELPHSDLYATSTPAPTIELSGQTDHALLVAIAPADVSPDTSLEALIALAAEHGIHFAARELAP